MLLSVPKEAASSSNGLRENKFSKMKGIFQNKFYPLFIFSGLLMSLNSVAQGTAEMPKVYVFLAEECPISIYMSNPLASIQKEFTGQVKFYAVFPNLKSNWQSAKNFLENQKLEDFEPIIDRDHTLTARFGAEVTPEAVILNKEGEVVYRGRINDAYERPGKMRHIVRHNDLQIAIQRTVSSQQISTPWPKAIGCFISKLPSQQP